MEYMDQYNFKLDYHPGKANVVADALSRKTRGSLSCLIAYDLEAITLLYEFGWDFETHSCATLFAISVQPTLISRILEAQLVDGKSAEYRQGIESTTGLDFWTIGTDKGLRFHDRLFVPESVRSDVLQESHNSRLTVHPGRTKMYHDVSRHFWWPGMKRDIAEFIS